MYSFSVFSSLCFEVRKNTSYFTSLLSTFFPFPLLTKFVKIPLLISHPFSPHFFLSLYSLQSCSLSGPPRGQKGFSAAVNLQTCLGGKIYHSKLPRAYVTANSRMYNFQHENKPVQGYYSALWKYWTGGGIQEAHQPLSSIMTRKSLFRER